MEKKRTDQSPETAALVKKYRKQIAITLILCLVSIGVIAGATAAWYASNKTVSAANSNITSETPTASLYIAQGETNDKKYYTSTTANAPTGDKGLYPISTVDCKNWYYVTGWTPEEEPVGSGAMVPKASAYTLVNNSVTSGMAVTYEDAGKTHVAYYKQPFTIYTDRDSLPVYLAGLEVSAPGEAAQRLQSGLRVAITDASDTLLLYYAPDSETGTGNSTGALTDNYTGINGTTADKIVDLTTNGTKLYNSGTIEDILATLAPGSTTEYQKPTGVDSFGTADTTGLTLYTYVWLEGTDAQTLAHITGGIGITDALSVKFTFVGVETPTTP